jgi:copper chaperone CopZ
MHCTGCEAVIENAIRQLPGIMAVNAEFAEGRLQHYGYLGITKSDLVSAGEHPFNPSDTNDYHGCHG